jgi:hypothetical protein
MPIVTLCSCSFLSIILPLDIYDRRIIIIAIAATIAISTIIGPISAITIAQAVT